MVRDHTCGGHTGYLKKNPAPTDPRVDFIWEQYRNSLLGRPTEVTLGYVGKPVLKAFGKLKPLQIDTAMCREYADNRYTDGVSQGTVWTELGHLNSSLKWAVKQRLIKDCPYIWRPQKPTPKERFFTKKEIAKLLSVPETPPHIQLAMLLLLSTAGRMSAVLELTWDRVDFDRCQINLRNAGDKTRKPRATIPINDGLQDALLAAQKDAIRDHVIEWAGGPVKSIRKGLSAVGQRADIPDVGAHIFRHTAAVHLAEGGVPMSEIAQFLGHSNTATTERVYARYSPAHLSKAAKILDFTTPKKGQNKGSIGVNYACCEIGRIPAAAASIARGVWCFGMTAR